MTTTTKKMEFDFDGLIELLAGHLYAEKKVFIRELIQNAHDGIQRRAAHDPAFSRERGAIDILTDLTADPARIVFRDNGIGMSPADLDRFLSTIGKSGTKTDHGGVPELIGQFGIGFLSGFVVGETVEVRTRHYEAGADAGVLWSNSGQRDYTTEPCARAEVGTEVTIYLRSATDRGLLHDDAIKAVIRQYADMLRVPIRLNDPGHHGLPINEMVMPWEREGRRRGEARLDAMVYLEKRVPDSVMETIPVEIGEGEGEDRIEAEGLLYITRTRVIAHEQPRTVRIFLKRMFLTAEGKELLPPWASFVNGILNTTGLQPNAARDNFTRDPRALRLRDRLGDLIVAHFEALARDEPERLSKILAYHDLGIKAACYYYEPFFAKFAHLLEWRINTKSPAAGGSRRGGRRVVLDGLDAAQRWATLPDIVASLPAPASEGPRRLSTFTTSSSANQFFEIADAAGATVVDASFPFESQLLSRWVEQRGAGLRLVHIDREDDPAIFKTTEAEADAEVRQLAQLMSQAIRPGGSGRVRVEARRFEPAALPAVLKNNEVGRGGVKARELLNDPNASSELRAMAEEMIRLSRNADMRMSINASNQLIRRLARLAAEDPNDADLLDLLLGVYNDAILYNQELMTPHNAKVFHDQFQRLLHKSAEFLGQKSALARGRAELEAARRARAQTRPARAHRKAFSMTPFAEAFEPTRQALRAVVEDELGCELQTANLKTISELISGNVAAHLDDADFYVADVTGGNANVMLELGGVLYGRAKRPTVLIAGVERLGDPPELPADLQGHIAICYEFGAGVEAIAAVLDQGLRRDERLAALLGREDRARYVSAMTLRAWTRELLQAKGTYARLSEAFPTAKDWAGVESGQLEGLLGDEDDLASVVLKRVRARVAGAGGG